MATITPRSDRYKTVVGWYGQCTEGNNGEIIECQDLQLDVFKNHISAIFQWTNDGLLKSWKHNAPSQLNKFNSFECGKLYFLTIKPSSTMFSIPNFVVSTHETNNLGLLTDECAISEPTPTPNDCACAPGGFREVEMNNIVVEHDYMTFTGFPMGSKLYYDETKVESAPFTGVYFSFSNGTNAGIINNTGKKPKNKKFNIKYGNKCYSASALDTNVSGNGDWFLDMIHTDTLPSSCGESMNLPTPTPQPEPTPTPVNCSCAPSNFVDVVMTAENNAVSILDDFMFSDFGGHSFLGFQPGVTISYDESTLNNDPFSTINITYPNTTVSPSIQMSGKAPSSSTVIFIKRGNECYKGTPVKSGTIYVCNMALVETLSSDCGGKLDFPTPTPQPRPTPTPVSALDCCPSETHTSVVTTGTASVSSKSDASGEISFTHQGFASNGRLCVNTNGTSYDDYAKTKFVYFDNNPNNPIGTLKKFVMNDDIDVYYINPTTNECFHGEITDSSKIILSSLGTSNVITPTPVAPAECCTEEKENLEFSAGNSIDAITVNQITVNASPGGEMDGTLCWPTLSGFAPPVSYMVKFDDLDQSDNSVYQMQITTQINTMGVTFNYEHKDGACYSGKLENPSPSVTIFNRIN